MLLSVITRNVCGFTSVSEAENWKASTGLYKELVDDKMKFYQYSKISKHQFNFLLQKIEEDLKRKILPSKKQYHVWRN
jgi:hypothetical protein